MARVVNGFVNQQQIEKAVARAEKALGPDVVRIRYDLRDDWSGTPALFFRVVLSDRASRRDHLHKTTQKIKSKILDEARPHELGLEAYFNFRSVSEQKELQEEAWA